MDENGEESTEELHFFYDAQSRPAFVEYEGSMYRYVHNLQGDIVGLLDGNGNLVVEYKYDAWGSPISISGSLKTTLGELNLFRYRGYVYDEEINLYYLRNRYYVAEIGHMLNADSFLGEIGLGFSHNTYTYCENNPVIKHDPDGCFAISVGATLMGIGVAVSVTLLGVAATVALKNVPKTPGKLSLKERIALIEIAVGTIYSNIQDEIKERAAERDKFTTITQQYRIDGAPYFFATLTGNGIWVVGDPMTFEVAFSMAIHGENVWTADPLDIYALACAVGAYSGYGVYGPEQGNRYSECWHYHLKRGNQKHTTHFFFGYENVEF